MSEQSWTVTMTALARAVIVVYADSEEEAMQVAEDDGFATSEIASLDQFMVEAIRENP
jgi:hypothetical protein